MHCAQDTSGCVPHPRGEAHRRSTGIKGIQGVKDALKCPGHRGPERPGRDARSSRTQGQRHDTGTQGGEYPLVIDPRVPTIGRRNGTLGVRTQARGARPRVGKGTSTPLRCPRHRSPERPERDARRARTQGQRHEARGIQGVRDALKCLGRKGPPQAGTEREPRPTPGQRHVARGRQGG